MQNKLSRISSKNLLNWYNKKGDKNMKMSKKKKFLKYRGNNTELDLIYDWIKNI